MARRNKTDSSAVLNELLRDENGNIIGMQESQSNYLSNNLGSERDARGGSCFVGDGNASVSTLIDRHGATDKTTITMWVKCPSDMPRGNLFSWDFVEFDCWWQGGQLLAVFCGENVTTLNAVIDLTEWTHLGFVLDRLNDKMALYVNGELHTEINALYVRGDLYRFLELAKMAGGFNYFKGQLFDVKLYQNDIIQDHFKFAEESGTKVYSSAGNKSVGTIVNPLPDNGNWAKQDIKSFFDDEGGIISDGVSYYSDPEATQLIPEGVLIPRID